MSWQHKLTTRHEHWENDDHDMLYIYSVEENNKIAEYEAIYVPWHGNRKVLYKGSSYETAYQKIERIMKDQKHREENWVLNKGNTRTDVEESKIAEEREG